MRVRPIDRLSDAQAPNRSAEALIDRTIPIMRPAVFRHLFLVAALLGGCSTQQLYNTAQAWQRNECNRKIDDQDRARCLSGSQVGYEDYKRQNDAGKAQK